MPLFNVTLLADVYVVADSHEEARLLARGNATFNEEIALEIKKVDNLRPAVREKTGCLLVAASVPDDIFAQLKGKTLAEAVAVLNPTVK